MGYYMHQMSESFMIRKEKQDAAMLAIKSLSGKETIKNSGGRHFSWVDQDFATKYDNLNDMMKAWRWMPEFDEDGNIIRLEFTGEKYGDDDILFEAIAPYVEAGSFIEMLGEEGERWKWKFNGEKCIEVKQICKYEDE